MHRTRIAMAWMLLAEVVQHLVSESPVLGVVVRQAVVVVDTETHRVTSHSWREPAKATYSPSSLAMRPSQQVRRLNSSFAAEVVPPLADARFCSHALRSFATIGPRSRRPRGNEDNSMSSIATAIKSEITRLARKEVKSETESMRSAVAQYRRDIAALKRTVEAQRKEIEFLKAQERKRMGSASAEPEAPLDGDVRFSAKSVRAQRKRLALSAEDFGKLIGVSGQTIYNWEQGTSRPREAQFAKFVAIRGIGKREAVRRLEMLEE